jgi:hypothetical protein
VLRQEGKKSYISAFNPTVQNSTVYNADGTESVNTDSDKFYAKITDLGRVQVAGKYQFGVITDASDYSYESDVKWLPAFDITEGAKISGTVTAARTTGYGDNVIVKWAGTATGTYRVRVEYDYGNGFYTDSTPYGQNYYKYDAAGNSSENDVPTNWYYYHYYASTSNRYRYTVYIPSTNITVVPVGVTSTVVDSL